ncbi:porin [Cloacibacillus sp.]
MIAAIQQWNDKWSTFLKYAQADYDENALDDAKNYTIGVNYQYTPAVAFQLTYDHIDYGDNNPEGFYSDDNHVVKFRTTVNF